VVARRDRTIYPMAGGVKLVSQYLRPDSIAVDPLTVGEQERVSECGAYERRFPENGFLLEAAFIAFHQAHKRITDRGGVCVNKQ
jgi:hypothetical protein